MLAWMGGGLSNFGSSLPVDPDSVEQFAKRKKNPWSTKKFWEAGLLRDEEDSTSTNWPQDQSDIEDEFSGFSVPKDDEDSDQWLFW